MTGAALPTADRSYTVSDTDIELRCFNTGPSQLVSHLILTGETYPAPPREHLTPAGDALVIVDIGANIGASSVWFAANYPDAKIHAVEPSPECLALLEHNLARWPNTAIHPVGLGETDRQAPLYRGVEDPVTGSLIRSALTGDRADDVTIRGVAGWLKETGLDQIDVLKVDTEGSEVPILTELAKAPGALLAGVSIIHLEFHSEDDRRAIDNLLTATHSLTAGSIYDHHRGELTYSSRTYLERLGRSETQRIGDR